MVVFHPFGVTANDIADVSGFSKLADREGFAVVYGVAASPKLPAWDAGGCCTQGTEDVKYVSDLLDAFRAPGAGFDPSRIYMAGMSNGAMLIHRLGAEPGFAGKVAAIGTVAGTSAYSGALTGPCPWIHFHGTKDSVIDYKRGANGAEGVEVTVGRWQKANKSSMTPKNEDIASKSGGPSTVKKQTWTDPNGKAPIVLFTIDGGGHTWPGGPPSQTFPALGKDLGHVTPDVIATEELWKFFKTFETP